MNANIDKDLVENLIKNKEVIVVKDGNVLITEDHHDYDFWIKED